MTQLLLDFAAPASSGNTSAVVVSPSRPTSKRNNEQTRSPQTRRSGPVAAAQFNGGVPLYDPAQGEIQHLGDLAQLVVARYDIVRRRRAARLAREAARRNSEAGQQNGRSAR